MRKLVVDREILWKVGRRVNASRGKRHRVLAVGVSKHVHIHIEVNRRDKIQSIFSNVNFYTIEAVFGDAGMAASY